MKIHIEDFSPSAIAESGQCFRMKCTGENKYFLIARDRPLFIEDGGDGNFTFSCSEEEFEGFWRNYFDLSADYGIYRALCLPGDEFLKKCISFGEGIRILNQDPFEMLISFIISQRKSVPAIRTSIERMCERLGDEIILPYGKTVFAFPEAEKIVSCDTAVLSECGLGYRTPYIRNAAERVLTGETDLLSLSSLSTAELIENLMEINGVGIKVASCEALFGYHRLDTVPVDVWMKRVTEDIYGGELPESYRPYAGVLQQYMFNYARLTKLKD